MINNKKWNAIIWALLVVTTITIISYWVVVSIQKTWESSKNSRLVSSSLIDVSNQRINNNQSWWDVLFSDYSWDSTLQQVNLPESKTLEVSIPSSQINNSQLNIDFSTWSTSRYISLELTKSRNNKSLINKNIDTRGWFILQDSSAWSPSDVQTNIDQQRYYLNNNKISDLSDLITSEIDKIGEPWSYLLIDFGYSAIFNRFNFRLTNDSKDSIPNILQLTFDNWVQHRFFVNDTNNIQNLFFPDTETRFIRIDVLSNSDGRNELTNWTIVSNVERNILPSEISYSVDNTNNKIVLNLPAISTINGVRFVNVYTSNNWRTSDTPFKSLLPNETSFEYFFDVSTGSSRPTKMYFELCSDIWVCLDKILKPLD